MKYSSMKLKSNFSISANLSLSKIIVLNISLESLDFAFVIVPKIQNSISSAVIESLFDGKRDIF